MKIKFKGLLGLAFSIALFSCNNSTGQQNSANTSAAQEPVVVKLNTEEFKARLDTAKDYQLLDVRTAEEFSGSHLKGAFNNDIYEADFASKNEKLDKNKTVFVYCKGGGRSAQAAEQLAAAGFKKVYDMAGGIMGWDNKGFPTESKVAAGPDKFSETDFTALTTAKTPVLIDFYATWCIPCKKMEPVIEKLSKEFDGKVVIKRLNVDESPALCKKLNVSALPVVKTFKGGKELVSAEGFQSEEQMRAFVAELLK